MVRPNTDVKRLACSEHSVKPTVSIPPIQLRRAVEYSVAGWTFFFLALALTAVTQCPGSSFPKANLREPVRRKHSEPIHTLF